ncbi:MAG TPA: hypothetical protein VEX60_14695 [Pyrinomonadaceae bacterium]|nr:hypothetical protein [Pyrinomonadaceae bacterium]
MNKQKLVLLCAIVFLCAGTFACGGGDTPQTGFSIKGEMYVQAFGGGLVFVSLTSVKADWQFDNGAAQGNTMSAFCGGQCQVNDGRVPARWFIVAGPFGVCPSQLTNPNMDVQAGDNKVARCLTSGILFPFSASPSSVNLQAPPATLDMTGSNLTTTYGMPRVEYVDLYTGNLIGTATATSVSGDGTWLQAATPDLSSVYSGTYTILVSNATSGGGFEYVGTATMDAYGRDGIYEDPPSDPPPCGCTGDGPCMPCEVY